jgi:Methylamine utilisation protein MauE
VFGLIARFVLALVLAGSAALKLANPDPSRAALATFEVEDERLRWIGWAALVIVELGLAVTVAAGSEQASWLAAGLLAMFAAALVGAILRGRAGERCSCFGSRSTVGWASVLRNLGLAACFAALPLLPEPVAVTRASEPSIAAAGMRATRAPANTGNPRRSRYPIEADSERPQSPR